MSRPFDVGLQLERTLLAWRRTCLALAVGVAVAVRYSEPVPLPFSLWFGLGAVGALALAYWATSARYRRAHRALQRDPHTLPTGGVAISLVAGVSLALGLAAASHLFATAVIE